jgi:hypothetical protein
MVTKMINNKLINKSFNQLFAFRRMILLILFLLLLLVSLYVSFAIPPVATEYYGTITYYTDNNTPVPVGSSVIAYYRNSTFNVSCGSFSSVYLGYYGSLSCLGDDIDTIQTEGGKTGEEIVFYINGVEATPTGDASWEFGKYKRVDLVPIPRCGDTKCNIGESCTYCSEDCGLCPTNFTINQTGNITNGTGGNETGGGTQTGGGAGGSGAGGTGSAGTGSATATGGSGSRETAQELCLEKWNCTEWTKCNINNTQYRECDDLNNCGTDNRKPPEDQDCIYQGTCFDYLLNQDETDLDCGGYTCDPCDLNKKCRSNRDCKSRFCHPENKICVLPTCFDGYMNGDEKGVDCGGPCEPCPEEIYAKPPIPELPKMIFCVEPFPWLLLLIMILVIGFVYADVKIYESRLIRNKNFKKLKKLEQLKKIFSLNMKINIFLFVSIIAAILISIYFYYFYLCVNVYLKYLWVFLIFITLLCFTAFILIDKLHYSEKKKRMKLKELLMTHEVQIQKIISIENSQLLILENKIIKNILKLLESGIVKSDELVSDLKFVSGKFSDLVTERDKTDDTVELEQEISEKVKKIKDNSEAKDLIEKDNTFKRLISDFDLVSKDYNDKKNLYDELRQEQEEVKRALEDYDRDNNVEPDKIEKELNQENPEETKEKQEGKQ